MLYDNAQLARPTSLAFELTGDPRWRAEAEATFAFIARTMTAPEGGFYSALDAETDGEEGAYYVWTRDDVKQALGDGPDADAFLQVYGLKRDPNFEKNRYVLLEPRTRAEQAETLESDSRRPRSAARPAPREAARGARPPPVAAARRQDSDLLERPDDRRVRRRLPAPQGSRATAQAAEKAADFLLTKLRTPDGRLLRTYRDGQAQAPRLSRRLRLPRPRPAPAPRRHRRPQAPGASQGADRPDDSPTSPTEGRRVLLHGGRPREPPGAAQRPVRRRLPGRNSVAIRNLVALASLPASRGTSTWRGRPWRPSARSWRRPPVPSLLLVGLSEYLDARPAAAGALARDKPVGPDDAEPAVVSATAALAGSSPPHQGKSSRSS